MKSIIVREELQRLAFCNSKRLPQAVNDNGVRKEWTGIGWIEAGKPDDSEPVVVDTVSCYTSADGGEGGCRGDKKDCILFKQGKCDIAEQIKNHPYDKEKERIKRERVTAALARILPG